MPEWPAFMSTETLSRYADIPVNTLVSLRARGEGPEWVKVGRRLVRYPKESADRWLLERSRKPVVGQDDAGKEQDR